GNFGSAAAAFILPGVALAIFGSALENSVDGWRYAIGSTGIFSIAYGAFFYWRARNTPEDSVYFKSKKSGGLEVSNKKDFWLYVAMNIPMYSILAVLAWKLSPAQFVLLSDQSTYLLFLVLSALCVIHICTMYRVIQNQIL